MTVYEIPNIENCTVTPMFNGGMYKIQANEGYYIHLNDGNEDTVNHWTSLVFLQGTYDFSQVQILAEADLPEGAEINNITEQPEIM